MADKKFTDFTSGAFDGNQYVVGYDSVANSERRYSDVGILQYMQQNLPFATSANTVLTGTTQAPTPARFDNSTKIATSAAIWQTVGNFSNRITVQDTAAQANPNLIDITYAGAIVSLQGTTAFTLNLNANIFPTNNGAVQFYNFCTAAVTLAAGTGVNIRTNSGTQVASVVLNPGDTAQVINVGAYWDLINGTVTDLYSKAPAFGVRPKFNGATPWDSANLPIIGARFIGVQVINSSTTATLPTGTNMVVMEVMGAGGGGGGSSGAGANQIAIGNSGNAGNYAHVLVYTTNNLTVTVGLGGAGGLADSSTTNGDGKVGGNTIVTNTDCTITVPGGAGGVRGTPFAPPSWVFNPVTPSTSTFTGGGVVAIMEDVVGNTVNPLSAGGPTTLAGSINGAATRWGNGGLASYAAATATSQAGKAAAGYGAGGSGCAITQGGAGNSGGTGGNGKVILYFYARQ